MRELAARQFLSIWIPWHLAGIAAVIFVPALIRFGAPTWSPDVVVPTLALGACYVATVIALTGVWVRTGRISFKTASAVTALGVGAVSFLILLSPFRNYSRATIVLAAGLTLLLLPAPAFLARLRLPLRAGSGLVALTGVALVLAFGRSRYEPHTDQHPILTHHYPIDVSSFPEIVPAPYASGGAIERQGDSLLLVTGDGLFYRVHWSPENRSFDVRELSLRVPINAAAFDADAFEHIERRHFRVADMLLEESGDGTTAVYVSHHFWSRDRDCLVLRLSATEVTGFGPEASSADWRTVYDTKPCLPPARRKTFVSEHAGGRLAGPQDGRLLMTVGDHGYDGWRMEQNYPQDPTADYGKTLIIDPGTGTAEHFTIGHRNHQGLFIDANGRIWSTEHGPQGGDELNLLVKGENYGWPLATYGKDYGDVTWPLNRPGAGSEYQPPVFAWVPSIAVSNLTSVRGGAFSRWRGDLLVSSLKGGLYRLKVEDDRVMYQEPIDLGVRTRDLAETADGLVLWVDGGMLMSLVPARSGGAAVFARCAGCHARGTGIGPPLGDIYGREIAGRADYDYSTSLSRLGGRWTDDRLDAFLADPDSFAPGTSMKFAGVTDSVERRKLIDYLKRLR